MTDKWEVWATSGPEAEQMVGVYDTLAEALEVNLKTYHGYIIPKRNKSVPLPSGVGSFTYWRASGSGVSGYQYGWEHFSRSPSGETKVLAVDYVMYEPRPGEYEYRRLFNGDFIKDDGDPLF